MGNLIYTTCTDSTIHSTIKNEGFTVECFANSDLLYEAFQHKNSDIVILDKAAPGGDGFAISAKIRQISNLPIIMLASQDSDSDYVFGISIGIDAYLTKPFSPEKLIVHIKTLLVNPRLGRYSALKRKRTALVYADVTLYPNNRTASCNNKELRLTNTEFNMMELMLKNEDKALSRQELLSTIWGSKSRVGSRATDDTVKRLRRKLTEADSHVSIDVVRGYGFRLGTK